MPNRAEQLFQKLQSSPAILKLVGQSEDPHFDCKEWPSKDEDAQRVFAKAACGLTNAEGGVLVVGMKARRVSKDEPDLVESAAPVADTSAVKSRILDLVGQLVEPGIEGVQAVEVNEPVGSKSGFVIVYIPASEGFPRRSRKNSTFYLRIGSGTFPMEYFQIADMFGRRSQPNLELYLELDSVDPGGAAGKACEIWWLGLTNRGRGIAKFPGIRFKTRAIGFVVDRLGVDGNHNHGLPRRPSQDDWIVFRGGVDDVIYPEATLTVAKLLRPFNRTDEFRDSWVFLPFKLELEISCEGVPTRKVEQDVPQHYLDKP